MQLICHSLSCIDLKEPLEPSLGGYIYCLVIYGLQEETADPEAAYRALVALGNFVGIGLPVCCCFC